MERPLEPQGTMASHLSGSVNTLAGGGGPKPRAVQKLEMEIEKIRSECNWRRGLDLTQQQVKQVAYANKCESH